MTNTRQPKVSFMEHAMLRRVVAGLTFGVALSFSALGSVTPADAQAAPLCTRFDEGTSGLDGWGACPSAPNIVVTTSNVGSIGGPTDYHLHLRDTAGASAACSTNQKYLGDWVKKMGGCGQFCFDFKLFKSGTPPASVHPSFSIYNGTQRATFVANVLLTSADPWQQHICAPIALGAVPPASTQGHWVVSSGTWNSIITGVTMIQLPVDFTSDPSEEVGYDNLCMSPLPCDPPPPAINGCLKDLKVEVKCNPDGSYTVTLSGSSFTGSDITLTSQTTGVTVTPPQQPWAATTTWTISGATPGQLVTLTANATKVGGGSEPGSDQCCSGEIKVVMPECPKPPVGELIFTKHVVYVGPILLPSQPYPVIVTCGSNTTTLNLLSNVPQSTGNIPYGTSCSYVEPTPPVPPNVCPPNTTGVWTTVFAPPSPVTINVPVTNVLVTNTLACRPAGEIVDVGIKKTGGTSPPPNVPWYGWHLTVTNTGAAIGSNGVITVSDVVPAGMTFTSATSTPPSNWSCNAPVSAGGTLICTYMGGAVTAGQVLSTIDIVAQASGPGPFPPFTNCATVGLTPVSGLADTNAANNNSCVTVAKPGTCPPPMTQVQGGQCACPAGTVQSGEQCVPISPPPPVCRPPMVPGPVAGQCLCPQGTVQKGRECVKQTTCQPPMVPGPVAGQCICGPGTVPRGKACVKETVCVSPAKSNGRGGCDCPEGMTKQGSNRCVKREQQGPKVKTEDVINGIGIMRGLGGGGGGGTPGKR